MVPSIKAPRLMGSLMETALSYWPMGRNTKVNGWMGRPTGRELRFSPMVQFMMEIGPMASLSKGNVSIRMVRSMRVNGKTVSPMARG